MIMGIEDSDCEKIREKGLAKQECCFSCHDYNRPDTDLILTEIEGDTFVICCHIDRELKGITLQQALGIA